MTDIYPERVIILTLNIRLILYTYHVYLTLLLQVTYSKYIYP